MSDLAVEFAKGVAATAAGTVVFGKLGKCAAGDIPLNGARSVGNPRIIGKESKAVKGLTKANRSVREAEKVAKGVGNLTVREKLLNSVSNEKLKNCISEMYRPGATKGDGGLADAIRHELQTGELVGGKSHMQKAVEGVKNLENIINKQQLDANDLSTAQKLLDDLKNALNGK